MLFKGIISVYTKNRMKPQIQNPFIVKARGTHSYHWDLKGWSNLQIW
jgi:hypothetical protein